jgi:hypothetical protein
MVEIRTTERELTAKISEWINEIIKRSNYPFTSSSVESSAKYNKKSRFGDLVIWTNRESNSALSLIELKKPFGEKEDLESFRQKLIGYRISIGFTWDFQNLNAYKLINNQLEFLGTESEPVLNDINEWIKTDLQAIIKTYLGRLLDEILAVNDTGKLKRFIPDKIHFVNFIRETVNEIVPDYTEYLIDVSMDKKSKRIVHEYAIKQGIVYPNPSSYFSLIAKQLTYGLVTRIIFYLTIRRYFKELPDLLSDDEKDLNKLLKIAFTKARDKDWQAVFVEDQLEELGIPNRIFEKLRKFFSELKVYHFGELADDVIGELFEEIIDKEERHNLGQFFTNENLVDLIIGLVVQDKDGVYSDPTCGSGTFLIRLYDRIKYLSAQKKRHIDCLNQIWGMDVGKFPAELSTINLFRQDISNYENFPRVIHTDIFDVECGREYEFPPPQASRYFNKIKITLPKFNGFVGNFPYIRQELIEKSNPSRKYKLYLTTVLANEYLLTYPKLFIKKGLNGDHLNHLSKLPKEKFRIEVDKLVKQKHVELNLSGQADIYAYIFIHTATLLAEKGTFGIITSNSWLDVSYGSVLKEFFLDNFNVKAVISTWAEPWFGDAAINTVITVLEKTKPGENSIVKFVKLKKKLSDLIPYPDLRHHSIKRWQAIDDIVNIIETSEYHHNLIKITDTISSVDTENMRIRLVLQNELKKEHQENGEFSKWGRFLRAPDVYFDIIEKCKDKLVPLKNIASIRRGYTTGINDFFYLQLLEAPQKGLVKCKNARGWQGELENEYLKPVIKSPKESQAIIIDPLQLKNYIFLCNKSKDELKKLGHIKTLKYVEWGEKQRTKDGIKWSEVPSVIGRSNWWTLDEKTPGYFLLQMINNERFLTFINKNNVQVDHNLFELQIDLIKNKKFFEAYFNSTLFALIKELNSRVNLGDGATKTEGIDWKNLILAPVKPTTIKFNNSKFFKRKMEPIFKEIKQKDRQELDKEILKALGLEPKEYLDKIYEGLNELVKERLDLPKLRNKKKKEETEKATEAIKQSVIEDIIPNGPKQFPSAFYFEED